MLVLVLVLGLALALECFSIELSHSLTYSLTDKKGEKRRKMGLKNSKEMRTERQNKQPSFGINPPTRTLSIRSSLQSTPFYSLSVSWLKIIGGKNDYKIEIRSADWTEKRIHCLALGLVKKPVCSTVMSRFGGSWGSCNALVPPGILVGNEKK